MSRSYARPREGDSKLSAAPAVAPDKQPQAVENRPDLLPEAEEQAPSLLDALEACFGEAASDVVLDESDSMLGDLGAEAATVDGTVVLPSAMNLDNPSADDLDTLGHEVSHALGSTSGEQDVDQEGDAAEASAEQAGATFATWVQGGMQGPAPQLSASNGGKGKVQRKHTSSSLTGSPQLSKGSRGRLVVSLQQLINEAGGRLAVDGIFGPATDRAVRRFQSANGLFVDGIVGPKTAAALHASHYREPEPAKEAPGGDKDNGEGPILSGRPMLKKGMQGPKVRTLQDMLSRAGFRTYVDGDFGAATERSVKSYQRSRGLGVDGVVGPKTANALSTNAPAVERGKAPEGGSSLEPGERKSFDPGNRLGKSEMNPQVARITEKTCMELQDLGYHPYVVSGFRSFNEQNSLYEQGRSKPGPKVTWVKGGGSWHNYGLAVDIAFWNSSGSGPSWSEHHPWSRIGSVGMKNGFTRWGGDFGDRPHLEYHPKWVNSASSLASTYHSAGLAEVWKKVGA